MVPDRRERLEAFVQGIGTRPFPSDRVALVTMVKDELDILPAFLEHHLRIVDRVYVIDHASIDGSRAYLRELSSRPALADRLEVLFYDGTGRHQDAVSTFLAQRAFDDGMDWVIAADADEFLGFSGAEQFRAALSAAVSPVASFEWKNLVPEVTASAPDVSAGFDALGWFEASAGDHDDVLGKVGLHSSFAAIFPHFRIPTGSHSVFVHARSMKVFGQSCGMLYHVPARSVAQVRNKRIKFLRAAASDGRQGSARVERYVTQLEEADRLIAAGLPPEGSMRLLRQVADDYDCRCVRDTPVDQRIRERVRLPVIASTGPPHLLLESPAAEPSTPCDRETGLVAAPEDIMSHAPSVLFRVSVETPRTNHVAIRAVDVSARMTRREQRRIERLLTGRSERLALGLKAALRLWKRPH